MTMNINATTGIIRLDRVVAEYDAWLDASLFPVPKMRVKVIQRRNDFAAFTNLRRCDRVTGQPDGTAGLGDTPDEALTDLLTRFVAEAREALPPDGFVESDFVWSAPEDF
ncbi:hypothetical protein Plim_3579 [Planctopirus limnophila DSM 3776]|uniref:Uncharacterized protein n=1 Tax=Planctopirus limnophila (strain ATCC 43296 / DSM 3776 / IFAM 1008 / Mu 290) TaxID=521674 RepID=D5SVN2_PLAL2|nr:hypothetical protein Plim_3579 [Planctopirus limnophila DSM 3776]